MKIVHIFLSFGYPGIQIFAKINLLLAILGTQRHPMLDHFPQVWVIYFIKTGAIPRETYYQPI